MNQAKSRLILLVVAAAAFIGWLSYLSYTALMKNRGPVVSRVQAAAAAHAVVVELSTGAKGKPSPEAKIAESFTAGSPAAGTEIYVVNIAEASGFEGPGEYLLLLGAVQRTRSFRFTGRTCRCSRWSGRSGRRVTKSLARAIR